MHILLRYSRVKALDLEDKIRYNVYLRNSVFRRLFRYSENLPKCTDKETACQKLDVCHLRHFKFTLHWKILRFVRHKQRAIMAHITKATPMETKIMCLTI